MRTYIKGFNLIKKKFKLSFNLLIILMLIGAILEGVSIAFILPFIDLLVNPDKIISNKYLNLSFFLKQELDYVYIIYVYSLIFFVVYFIKNIVLILINYTQSKILLDINFYLSNLYFSKLLNQNFLNLIEEKSSTIIRTMISQTTSFAMKFIHSATLLIAELLTFIFVLTFMFMVVGKEFYLVMIMLIFVLVIYYLFFKKKIYQLSRKTEFEEMNRLKNLTNGIDSINEINIFNIKKFFIESDFKINFKIIKLALLISLIRTIPKGLIEVILISFFLLFVIYSTKNNFDFVNFIPSIAVLAAALFKFVPTLNRVMVSIQKLEASKPVIENIYEKLNLYDENKILNLEKNNSILDFNKDICLKDISFSYSNLEKNIFENFNLDIKKNQKIGIYGDTGSGKSTLVKMLMGVILPSKGKITVDGLNINSNIQGLQKIISYIPQKIFLFESSLKNNIKLFQDENNDVKFDEIITKVFKNKKNFNDLSNEIKENHTKLSGGELKKIGIARALYKDHKILIIDEGTAGLDAEYSKYIISEILNMNKTVFFISHDLSQIKNFDVVYKIEKNKLIG